MAKSNRLPADARIWITGASSGIGAAVARRLLRHGYRLVLSGRRREPLDAIAQTAPASQTLVLPLDITDLAAVQAAGAQIQQHWGALDAALLNAGTCEYLDARQFDSTLVRHVMETNVMGLVHCIEASLPLLRQGRDPLLMAVASAAAYCPLPRAEAYGASKAAVSHFMESLRNDLSPQGIDVSVVYPGFVDTPLTERNDFAMPMQVDAETAAMHIQRGLEQHRRQVRFPGFFVALVQGLGALPLSLRFWLTRKMVRS